jgi:hypothetical protein
MLPRFGVVGRRVPVKAAARTDIGVDLYGAEAMRGSVAYTGDGGEVVDRGEQASGGRVSSRVEDRR